jgi:hypothetical protein
LLVVVLPSVFFPYIFPLLNSSFFHFYIILSGVRLSPLGTAATTAPLYQTQIIDDGDYGAIGGMKIDRGNRSTWRKPAPVPHCPPQIPYDLTRARTFFHLLFVLVSNARSYLYIVSPRNPVLL